VILYPVKTGMKMKRNLLLLMSIMALVAALFMGTSAVMADKEKPGSQTWYLDGYEGYAGQAANSLQMVRSGTHPGKLTLYSDLEMDKEPDMNMVWVANLPAENDNTFNDGSWVLNLSTDKNWAPKSTDTPQITVNIGGYDPNTKVFYYFDTVVGANVYIGASKLILVTLNQATTATIRKGDYLIVRIYNNDPAGQHDVYFSGASTLISPVSDPGYACPEVATGLLFGVGLIGLVSYVAIRRKKAAAS
jgi:hypothetical protein